MKNSISITAAAVVLLLVVCILSSGCVGNKDTYVVSVDPALQPFSVVSSSGEPEGFDVDMMKWIAEDLGVNFEFIVTSHNDYLKTVDEGNIDFRPGLIITDARKEILLFPEPYLESHYSLLAKKGSTVTKETFLNGENSVAVSVNSAYVNWLKNHFGEEKYNQMVESGQVIIEKNVDRSVFAVISGEADTVICGDIVSIAQADNYPSLKFVTALDGTICSGIAIPKSKPELVELMNKGVANFKASAYYNELKDKYNLPYQKDTYKVGIDIYNRPFTYIGENGELTGLDYDSIMWIADKYGFNVEFVNEDWNNNIDAIRKEKIDLWYSGMTITDKRSNWITFSVPYLAGEIVVLCSKNKPITKDQFESGNIILGVQEGTTNEEWAVSFFGKKKYSSMVKNGNVVPVLNQEDMYQASKAGEIDCIAVDEVGSKDIIKNSNLMLVAAYEGGGDYAVAMRDGDIVLIDIINQGLEELKSSGVFNQLLKKYNL